MKTSITIIACLFTLSTAASAADSRTSVTVDLPDSVQLTDSRGYMGGSNAEAADVITGNKGQDYGVYCGSNGGAIELDNGEGNWVIQGDKGSMSTFGRSGAGGDSFVLVLGNEIQTGTVIHSLTFTGTVTPPADMSGTKNFGLAVGIGTSSAVQTSSTYTISSVGGTANPFTVTLDLTDPYTWTEGSKIYAAFAGDRFTPNTNSLCVTSDIQVTALVGSSAPVTLTETSVKGAHVDVNGANVALTLDVDDNLSGESGNFNVIVGKTAWEEIVTGMGETPLSTLATVTLVGADGVRMELNADSAVTINGYGGTDGLYRVDYIPEPSTATLSLLVLAGLFARRRRK